MKNVSIFGAMIILFGLFACSAAPAEFEPEANAPAQETAVSDQPPPAEPTSPKNTPTTLPASEATASANLRLEVRATSSAAEEVEVIPPTATPAIVVENVPEEILTAVFNDLTQQTNLARSQFTIIQAMPVTWSDGSLGCPQPGVMYTTALVDGYHIILQQGDSVYDYRVTNGGAATQCPNPANVIPPAQGTPSS